ncbi:AraC family transcriptional regulator [Paenibacillus alba]|uniref:AraC family transcriptional regulator n=1 Tax=Paenibacillus alba TaxID=1197127 RepID=A0ABU6GC06_9BACL|nr:helix-turn-helix domain-containing protein [Paenibacillus alba]MEC0231726.1 AraC family transcriptional regulator [Paenibacillus alba]NQX70331.1 helix-turn-helix transcriptional regulator [Paenibacillus alba]
MKPVYYESTSFEISRKKQMYTSMPSKHYHDAYEILYLVSGDFYYVIGERTYQVVAGTLLFMNIYEIHKLVNSNNNTYERVTLLFKKEFLQHFCTDGQCEELLELFTSDYHALKTIGKDQLFIEQLFQKMIHEGKKQARGYEQYQHLLLVELLLYLNRKIFDSHETGVVIESNRTHKKVLDIVSYVNVHYMEPLKLCDISQQFDISSSYLCRTFKEAIGFTLIEYINNIRIKEARELLVSSSYNITEIAGMVGFDHASHFGRTFKLITGISPLSFRKQSKL